MPKHFDGNGFKITPIEGSEAAEHRHLMHEIDANWGSLSDAGTLINGFAILSKVIKFGTPVLLLAGVGGFLLKILEKI